MAAPTMPDRAATTTRTGTGPARIVRWPVPALAAWSLAWGCHAAAGALSWSAASSFAASAVLGLACARWGRTASRRFIVGAGFPLSYLASGASDGLPAALWLAPLAVLAVVYPMRRWGDAPLFPTPITALRGLATLAPLPPGSRILDAGSGSGAALRALHAEYPHARLDGIEWSAPLCWLSAWRCPWARIRRGDIWAADWSAYDMVYLFQRPETTGRALRKAAAELRAGAVLVSLEFEAPGIAATGRLEGGDRRPVWVYMAPLKGQTNAVGTSARR